MGVAETSHADLQSAARDHLILHYANQAAPYEVPGGLLVLERGEGPYVFDTQGKRYIDAMSCLACCQLGYSHGEEIAAAATAQLTRLAFNTTWGTAHPAAINLAARLAEVMPGRLNHSFFTMGGSEAVESAYKLAREHFLALGQTRRRKVIARKVAYHGSTLGALAITGVAGIKAPYEPALEVVHVSNTNAFRDADGIDEAIYGARLLAELRAAVAAAGPEEVAMIIAEPIQNAGGCLVPPPGYWSGLRELADECGALLVSDEVICGFGRLGTWLGIEREGVEPDLATVAKGLTSAYAPLGAVIANDRVVAPLCERSAGPLRHGLTFGGHPLSAAIALANIEIFEREGVLANVISLEDTLAQELKRLRELPIVGDVRGRGFFWAIELVRDENRRFEGAQRDELLGSFLPARLREAGIIARPDGRGDAVIQIAPPLICEAGDLREIADGLERVLGEASAWAVS